MCSSDLSPKVTRRERTHLRAYIPLWIGGVLFFMISEQAAGKMATFAKSNTDGRFPLFGWVISPETYQTINPATIVILAPLVGWFFTRRAGRFPGQVDRVEVKALTTPENDLSRKAAQNPAILSSADWETWYCTAYACAEIGRASCRERV